MTAGTSVRPSVPMSSGLFLEITSNQRMMAELTAGPPFTELKHLPISSAERKASDSNNSKTK
jgi:hypothetical protein